MTIEDDILEQIAPIEQRNSKKRHSYVIIGKPGCGKTSLAEKLAKITDNQIINFEETLLDMQNNLSNSFYAQVDDFN
jgi:replication-associated recombination protein RarA